MADSSSSTLVLPARPVHRKHGRTKSQVEQAARVGVGGMQYTILRDPPWMADDQAASAPSNTNTTALNNSRQSNNIADINKGFNRVSDAPTVSSTYSDDVPDIMATSNPSHMMPQPLTLNKHDRELTPHHGPAARQTKLPIFKQVRHMLHKPTPLITSADNVKWDPYSGELSENGKAPQVKPSTYVSPFQGLLKPHSERLHRPSKVKDNKRDVSPVSVLDEQDLSMHPATSAVDSDVSPVSPISRSSSFNDHDSSSPAAHFASSSPEYLSAPAANPPVRRRLVPNLTPITSSPAHTENTYPPSEKSDWSPQPPDSSELRGGATKDSHFSWTTVNTSSTTRGAPYNSSPIPRSEYGETGINSRFSWTTTGTPQTRPLTAAHDDTPPALPNKVPSSPTTVRIDSARGPPVQSILSRSRPVQPRDREEELPVSSPIRLKTAPGYTPGSRKGSLVTSAPYDPPAQTGSAKKLPLPPELAMPKTPMSHLENLVIQEKDLERQRLNTKKGIAELEKLEKASPLEVPFATVRDAKRRLEEYRLRLSEVERDLREVGICIARIRRKDGMENTLWVRRVTD